MYIIIFLVFIKTHIVHMGKQVYIMHCVQVQHQSVKRIIFIGIEDLHPYNLYPYNESGDYYNAKLIVQIIM